MSITELEAEFSRYIISEDKVPTDLVGPVLTKAELAYHIIDAIITENPDNFMGIIDRGSYVRVIGRRRLRLSRKVLEEVAGREVRFPGEVEVLMSAFAGRIRVTGEYIEWYLEGGSP
jgi:toluene monooxygenase system protein D